MILDTQNSQYGFPYLWYLTLSCFVPLLAQQYEDTPNSNDLSHEVLMYDSRHSDMDTPNNLIPFQTGLKTRNVLRRTFRVHPRPLSVWKVAGWSPPGEHSTNSGWTWSEIRARARTRNVFRRTFRVYPRPLPIWKLSVRTRCVNRNRKSQNEHISSRFLLFLYDDYT